MVPPAFCTAAVSLFVKRNHIGTASTATTPLRRARFAVSMRKQMDAAGVEYITLESFIKLKGVSSTGGHAKMMITEGLVTVNGQNETRRGRKLRQGDVVLVDSKSLAVDFS